MLTGGFFRIPRNLVLRLLSFRAACLLLAVCLPVAASLLMAGCSIQGMVDWTFGPNRIEEGMNPKFSINLCKPPWWWPDEDSFDVVKSPTGKVEKIYLKEHGKPDYIRILYNKEGNVVTSGLTSQSGAPPSSKAAWIYLEKKQEVTFTVKGAKENPLNAEVNTIIEYGDPDEMLIVSETTGNRMVKFMYRGAGLIVSFNNYKVTGTQRVPPLPGWMH